jgi:hypothetical protein
MEGGGLTVGQNGIEAEIAMGKILEVGQLGAQFKGMAIGSTGVCGNGNGAVAGG